MGALMTVFNGNYQFFVFIEKAPLIDILDSFV